ncbi:MAG: hypothetical protein RXO71_05305 [Nitrososphaeria archaeon]
MCLSDNILYAQYHVEELSITMYDPSGIESEKFLRLSGSDFAYI